MWVALRITFVYFIHLWSNIVGWTLSICDRLPFSHSILLDALSFLNQNFKNKKDLLCSLSPRHGWSKGGISASVGFFERQQTFHRRKYICNAGFRYRDICQKLDMAMREGRSVQTTSIKLYESWIFYPKDPKLPSKSTLYFHQSMWD